MKRLFALLLALSLLGTVPALAAEEAQSEPLPTWSYHMVADSYAMGLFGDEIYTGHDQIVTQEQVDALAQKVADKLALLNMALRPAEENNALVLDTTRGGVVNALYQAAAAYAFPGIEQAPADYMTSVGALCGDGTGLHLDRPCTMLEAAAMANALILSLYDSQNAGSLGLLWQATNGTNTLYLLGSIHMDRNNVYPIHKQLRDIILNAEQVSFELDFNDQEGVMELAAMQVYSDGTTLADHISPALYRVVVDVAAQLGMSEEQVAQYKAWALATSFQSVSMMDETTGDNAMAIDLYVNAKAVNAGIGIGAVETYAFQGGLFDTLSPEYQEASLASSILMLLGTEGLDAETEQALTEILGPEALEPESQEALGQELDLVGEWMEQWKIRAPEEFAASYDKEAILASDDEMNRKLFTDRDPGMIAYADSYLQQEGAHTGLLVVGAGHMVGDTGIVQGLRDLGYTVEVVPAP